jgi:transposase
METTTIKNSDIIIGQKPEGIEGAGFFATSLDKVVGMARKNSIWPLPFATSCCGIEFMATMGSHYDLARFGAERLSFSPRQADLLMVMGTIAKKDGPDFAPGLRADGRAPLGAFGRGLRFERWYLRHLFCAPGHRSDHPG